MSEKIIYVKKVETEVQKMNFIKFPWKIYKDYKNWVPPIIYDVRKNLDTVKNPFYKHAVIELYIAYLDGKEAGRIAAIVNDNHNEFHKEKTGFFGYFECIDDQEVADALFNEAAKYVKSKGMDTLRGPVNLSTNDEVGLLVEGFDLPPIVLMLYNPKYYINLIENCGFAKAKDLYAYNVPASILNDEKVYGKLSRISDLVMKKENIKIRTMKLSNLKQEVQVVREVYNQAWQYNWGFIPMTEEEFDFVAASLKPIVDEDFVYFAEVNGKPVGFSLTLPDVNKAFIKMNGRLFPFGFIKFLLNKKKIDGLRMITMGVISEYQRKGIEAVFIKNTIDVGIRKNYKSCEISWILEDNIPMVQTAVNIGADRYKTYRLYDKKIF